MSAEVAVPAGLPAGGVVLLVDWPGEQVPRDLLAAGFIVVSANLARGTTSSYAMAGDGHLDITPIDSPPPRVDAVGLFRPPEEHAAIARRAVELGARTLWVQRGSLAADARRIAAEAGLEVIEGPSADE